MYFVANKFPSHGLLLPNIFLRGEGTHRTPDLDGGGKSARLLFFTYDCRSNFFLLVRLGCAGVLDTKKKG